MEGHTEVAPLKFDDQLPCQFCNFQSVCHVDTIIDSTEVAPLKFANYHANFVIFNQCAMNYIIAMR